MSENTETGRHPSPVFIAFTIIIYNKTNASSLVTGKVRQKNKGREGSFVPWVIKVNDAVYVPRMSILRNTIHVDLISD